MVPKLAVAEQELDEVLQQYLSGTGLEPWPVNRSITTMIPETKRTVAVEESRPATAKEICAQFLTDLSGLGIRPQKVALNGAMKFEPVTMSLRTMKAMPAEAEAIFHQIQSFPSSAYFTRWGVLVEVPPPAPPPNYHRDPWLAFKVGNSYYGVYHWD